MEHLETNVVSVHRRDTNSSEAGGWEDKVELSSEVPSQKETGQSRVPPEASHGGLTLPAPELGTSGTPRMAT